MISVVNSLLSVLFAIFPHQIGNIKNYKSWTYSRARSSRNSALLQHSSRVRITRTKMFPRPSAGMGCCLLWVCWAGTRMLGAVSNSCTNATPLLLERGGPLQVLARVVAESRAEKPAASQSPE